MPKINNETHLVVRLLQQQTYLLDLHKEAEDRLKIQAVSQFGTSQGAFIAGFIQGASWVHRTLEEILSDVESR